MKQMHVHTNVHAHIDFLDINIIHIAAARSFFKKTTSFVHAHMHIRRRINTRLHESKHMHKHGHKKMYTPSRPINQ